MDCYTYIDVHLFSYIFLVSVFVPGYGQCLWMSGVDICDQYFVRFEFNEPITRRGANCVATDFPGGVWCC